MIRTQIQLTEAQAAKLRGIAHRRHVSLAAVIRQALDELPAEDDWRARRDRAIRAMGAFAGDGANVSEEHDRYLEEAYADGIG
jgi:Arc/MetJ-type ribon-helix-helix transcriptional regulator